MPRVTTHKASTRRYTTRDRYVPEGKQVGDLKDPYRCSRCNSNITPGNSYFEWSFRYGGTYRQCMTCGYPRPSQLTQSKLSTVYSAVEDADFSTAETREDLEQLLSDLADVVREVAQEYEDAAESFGGQGENQERADELNGWADELEDALSGEADEPDPCQDHEEFDAECDACSESHADWLEQLRTVADEAANGCPL